MFSSPTKAQLTPDQTLGAEASTVTFDPDVNGNPADVIEGGAARGANLFHSFLDFNVGDSKGVYFDSPEGIDTILSRVTGSNLSTINGLLGTTGDSNAALILMNPNGIVFGENASLDVQGAFAATTATSIQLGESGSFSAIDPKSDSLLSINPSASFFSGQTTPSQILVESQQGLSVLEGKSLSLVGGDVVVDGGRIVSPGSRVNIVAVGAAGVVDANSREVLSSGNEGGSLRIENDAFVSVASATEGEATFVAEDIQISSGSNLFAGIQGDLGSLENQAGSLILEGAQIRVSGEGTVLGNIVSSGSVGQGGDVVLSARNIEVEDGPIISTLTLGSGDAGDILIDATGTVEVSGRGTSRVGIISGVGENAVGQGGDIETSATDLELVGGVFLGASTFGDGDAGDIRINASKKVVFDGGSDFNSVSSSSAGESSGRGGDVEISAANVEVLNGARINTTAVGRESPGKITINASETVIISGVSEAIGQQVFNSAVGSLPPDSRDSRSGDIEITATNLQVTEGGVISSPTIGSGDAGVIRLNISGTALFDGVVSIQDNFTQDNFTVASGVGSNGAQGNGGRIELSARNLRVTNGAQIIAASLGEGDAGDISIDVAEVARIDGANLLFGDIPSFIGSGVLLSGTGQGGSVHIAATDLEVVGGATIGSSVVSARGDAGNIKIDVTGTVRVDGVNPYLEGESPSSISSDVMLGAEGHSGSVEITANNLEVTNGGSISTSVGEAGRTPISTGNAGNINIVANTVLVDGVNPFLGKSASVISSGIQESGQGQGGSVLIETTDLEVTNGGQIGTSTLGLGNAGEFIIIASGTVRFNGYNRLIGGGEIFPSLLASGVEEGGRGQGGNVTVFAKNLEISDKARISAASAGEGDAGRINLEIGEQILVEEEGSILTRSSSSSGGQIAASANSLILRENGNISTSVRRGEGTGGDIALDINYIIALDDSNISSASADGRGGNIDLSRATLFSQTLNPIVENSDRGTLAVLENNGRVDIDATGGVASGQVSTNDASFIENDLSDLPDVLVDTDALLANACIARSGDASGALVLRGGDRSAQSPTAPLLNTYSTSTVQSTASQPTALQEPQALYQLANGRTVMSHRCE